MLSPDSKFDECFKRFVVECKFVKNPCSTTGITDVVVVPKAINQPLPPHLTLTEDDVLDRLEDQPALHYRSQVGSAPRSCITVMPPRGAPRGGITVVHSRLDYDNAVLAGLPASVNVIVYIDEIMLC